MTNPSNTICSRAWTDFNLDLHLDQWRYCCKAIWTPIPDVLSDNYFTDNSFIRKTRKELLEGIQTESCKWCWKDYEKNGTAWREVSNEWTEKKLKEKGRTLKQAINGQKFPHMFVLTFDNICDQSCLYCGPNNSTKWVKELNQPTGKDTDTIKQIDQLVSWFEKSCKSLEYNPNVIMQMLGGEPTYSHHFYYFLDRLKNFNLDKHIQAISVTTNGNTIEKTINDKLLKIMNAVDWEWHVGLSNEACGKLGENIRYGLDMKNFERNFKTYLNHPKVSRIVFSPTMNIFNIKNFHNYIEWCHNIIRTINKNQEFTWVGNWVNFHPNELDCRHLPKEFVKYIDMAINTMKSTSKDLRIDQTDNIYVWFDNMKKRIIDNDDQIDIAYTHLDYLSTIKPSLDKDLLLNQLKI